LDLRYALKPIKLIHVRHLLSLLLALLLALPAFAGSTSLAASGTAVLQPTHTAPLVAHAAIASSTALEPAAFALLVAHAATVGSTALEPAAFALLVLHATTVSSTTASTALAVSSTTASQKLTASSTMFEPAVLALLVVHAAAVGCEAMLAATVLHALGMSSTEVTRTALLVLHAGTIASHHVPSAAAMVPHAANTSHETSTALLVPHAATATHHTSFAFLVTHATTMLLGLHPTSTTPPVAHAATTAEDTSTTPPVAHATTTAIVARLALLVLHAASVSGTATSIIAFVVCSSALLIAHAQVLLPALLALLALLEPCATVSRSPPAPGEVSLPASLVLHAAAVRSSTVGTILPQRPGTALAHGNVAFAHGGATLGSSTTATHQDSPPELCMCMPSTIAVWLCPLQDGLPQALHPFGQPQITPAETHEASAPALNSVEFPSLELPFLAIAGWQPCPFGLFVPPHNANTTRAPFKLGELKRRAHDGCELELWGGALKDRVVKLRLRPDRGGGNDECTESKCHNDT